MKKLDLTLFVVLLVDLQRPEWKWDTNLKSKSETSFVESYNAWKWFAIKRLLKHCTVKWLVWNELMSLIWKICRQKIWVRLKKYFGQEPSNFKWNFHNFTKNIKFSIVSKLSGGRVGIFPESLRPTKMVHFLKLYAIFILDCSSIYDNVVLLDFLL